MHRRAEEINETTKQWVRHRGLKLVLDHAEVVKCDISATANTLKSQDTPNLLSPISNIRAVTLKLYSRAPAHGSKFARAESLPRCSTVPAASSNEGFYKVALICVFEARLHRATSQKPHRSANARPPVTQTGPCSQLPLAVILAPRARPRHNGFVVHAWLHRAGCPPLRTSSSCPR